MTLKLENNLYANPVYFFVIFTLGTGLSMMKQFPGEYMHHLASLLETHRTW